MTGVLQLTHSYYVMIVIRIHVLASHGTISQSIEEAIEASNHFVKG
jgi:hypothetical protein